jgi:hypothetical protein
MGHQKQIIRYPNSGAQANAGHIPSTSLASGATTLTTDCWVKADFAATYLLLCEVTTHGGGSSTFSIRCASDKDGAGAAAITGCETVAMTAVGHAVIQVSGGALTTAKPFICGYAITAGGTNVCKAILVGLDPKFSP